MVAHDSKLRLRQWAYLTEEIREDLLLEAELLLLACSTGIHDAASWADYGCFASNQIGFALFIAIGAAGLHDTAYSMSHVAMSLGMFHCRGTSHGLNWESSRCPETTLVDRMQFVPDDTGLRRSHDSI